MGKTVYEVRTSEVGYTMEWATVRVIAKSVQEAAAKALKLESALGDVDLRVTSIVELYELDG